MSEKKGKTQAGDRKRVLAAIRAEQKYIDAQERIERESEKTAEVFARMARGKDLKGLRELNEIFKELKGSFVKSEGFKMVHSFLKGEIHECAAGRGNFQKVQS